MNTNERLYNFPIPIIGLTGGIATGKSTVSNILKESGYFVVCADSLVKNIYSYSETVSFIKNLAPQVIGNNEIDFKALRQLFFSEQSVQQEIEEYIYNRLGDEFLKSTAGAKGLKLIIYDAPVLFEKKFNTKVDTTVCVYAPKEMQLKRLISRDGCSMELAEKILSKQMSIEEKKLQSNYTIENTGNLSDLKKRTLEVFNIISGSICKHMSPPF